MAQALDANFANSRVEAINLSRYGTGRINPRNLYASQMPHYARELRYSRARFERQIEAEIERAEAIRGAVRIEDVSYIDDVLENCRLDSDDLHIVQTNVADALELEGRTNEAIQAARDLAAYTESAEGVVIIYETTRLTIADTQPLRNDLTNYANLLENTIRALHDINEQIRLALTRNRMFAEQLQWVESEYNQRVSRRSKNIGSLAAQDVILAFGREISISQISEIATFAIRAMHGWQNWASGHYVTNISNKAFLNQLVESGVTHEIARSIFDELSLRAGL